MNEEIIIITEEYWMNSQLSVARYYGAIQMNGSAYILVNKNGIPIFELRDPKSPHYIEGDKVIPPGEPADLVREDWFPIYRKLGRDKILEIIERKLSLKDAKKLINSKNKSTK